jgi:predicted HAD superfamily Cof-like phosphohydrolase
MRPTDGLVREFHEQTGQLVADHPTIPEPETVRHRLRLLKEEMKEVEHELVSLNMARSTESRLRIMERLLKELCDLRYVADGTCVSLGLPYDEAYREVHAANMTKRFPDGTFHTNANGKVLKGPNYRPPDMSRFVPQPIDGTVA